MGKANIKIAENTLRTGTFGVRVADNVADADLVTLDTKLRAMILGTSVSASKSLDIANYTADATTPPKTAQRGQKWLIRGTGNDGEKYTLTLPCADPALIAATGSDFADLAEATIVAPFVTALQAVWVDKAGGAVTVNSIEYRNYRVQ